MILAGIDDLLAAVGSRLLDTLEEQGRQEARAGLEGDVLFLDQGAVLQLEDHGKVRESGFFLHGDGYGRAFAVFRSCGGCVVL